jgi:hypothetical protein
MPHKPGIALDESLYLALLLQERDQVSLVDSRWIPAGCQRFKATGGLHPYQMIVEALKMPLVTAAAAFRD